MPTTPQMSFGNVEEYDPAKNTWRERSPMPTPRNHTAAGVISGKIYVAGGRVGAAFIGLASDISVVEEYDPATDKWGAPRARMPTARSALGVGSLWREDVRGRGRISGPAHDGDVPRAGSLRSGGNTWSVMPPMPVSRHGLAAGVIGNRLILVGGDVQSAGTGFWLRRAKWMRSCFLVQKVAGFRSTALLPGGVSIVFGWRVQAKSACLPFLDPSVPFEYAFGVGSSLNAEVCTPSVGC